MNFAASHLVAVPDAHQRSLILITDGEPSCVGGAPGAELARSAAIEAISAARERGFYTYVVGVPTLNNSAVATLNAMASAGGKAQGAQNPLASQYYPVADGNTLLLALRTIARDASAGVACRFTLPGPPPAPDFVAVRLDGEGVPRDTARAEGWDYLNAERTTLALFGAACAKAASAASGALSVTYGCGARNLD